MGKTKSTENILWASYGPDVSESLMRYGIYLAGLYETGIESLYVIPTTYNEEKYDYFTELEKQLNAEWTELTTKENLDKLNDISVINQVSKHEIQSRIGRSDNYVECFPTMEDTIKGFDETNFAQKVKEKYYDEDVIQKDQEWMNSKRTKFAFSSKVGDDKQKKRDAKFKNKVNRETAEVNAFISKKD